ncbi:MAG: flagellar filament capping protein FliD [Desulfamplus sp.]|nr:flagellar filament capping protein FliD [Desulfamplus sp.]
MASGGITSLGVGSGLELQSMLEQLREVDSKPIETKKTKQTELNQKVEEFNSIKSSLLSIRSKALELSLGSNFIEKKASVSGTSINATSVSGAREISHSVNVTSLATNSTWASEGVSSKTASIASEAGTFSYKLGQTGSTISLDISSGTTLQGLVDKINSDKSNPGVIATIADTGFGDNPYKLVLSSKNTGEENRISMVNSNSPITSDSAVNISPGTQINITSGANDQIVFREKRSDGTLGSDQTATIPQGSYSNPNYFASAIKSAMESASTNGTKFSVSYDDNTKKFSIKEDGSTLNELQIDWSSSNSASSLGFDAEVDNYKKPFYSMLNMTETNGAGKTPSTSDNTVSLSEGLTILNASSNNKIVFRERLANGELGEERTAAIADGFYTNGNDLASAIKSAMESASANGTQFSVLFDDTTKKLTIKEDGSNLHELQMVWGKSNAAASLGFDSETDIYKPYDSILNARFNVDGIDYQRQSNNEITDVVSGISLDLKETGSSSFNVDSDFEKVQTNLEEIVSTLNTLITDTKAKSKYDINNKEKGILFGESSVLRISEDIKTLMGQKFDAGGEISTLYDLGLEVEKDGTLSINTTTLQKAFSSNSEDVIKFFTGDSEKKRDGFGDMLYEKMTKYTGSTGLMTVEIDSAQARISKMDLEIQEDTKRLDQRYESLTKQFVKLDSFMSQMKSQSSFLDMMFNTNKKDK